MDRTRIFEECKRRFGLGEAPHVSTRLYNHLQTLVNKIGEPALLEIADVADCARSKERPGHWFRKVILLRLQEKSMANADQLRVNHTRAEVNSVTASVMASLPRVDDEPPPPRTQYEMERRHFPNEIEYCKWKIRQLETAGL